jgi:hypothetical protein
MCAAEVWLVNTRYDRSIHGMTGQYKDPSKTKQFKV